MKRITLSNYGRIKLNSYRPLCLTQTGLNAIEKYNLHPFIDASCRREPDFENPYPSISALCRQGQFATHLRKNDIVVYMTVGRKFKPHKKGHHLVSILQVIDVYTTHEIAKTKYLESNLLIPNNCMVANNPPNTFSRTGGNFANKTHEKKFLARTIHEREKIGERRVREWDDTYLYKSKKWPCFVKTHPLFLDLSTPPLLLKSDFNRIFGKIPNTRTPRLITEEQLIELAKIANLQLDIK